MRELKFRAWIDGESGILKRGFVYFNLADLQHYLGIPALTIRGNVLAQCAGCSEEDSHPPIEQYTGLKDKNKEIYEGDIVRGSIDGEVFTWSVVWEEDRDLLGWSIAPQNIEDGLEVIGNIHENLELLDD